MNKINPPFSLPVCIRVSHHVVVVVVRVVSSTFGIIKATDERGYQPTSEEYKDDEKDPTLIVKKGKERK